MKPLCLFLFCGMVTLCSAQRALPGFVTKELARGKNQISWINPYPSCIQLAVQRSTDSINFRTIFSAQSPQLPSNGFVDSRPPMGVSVYYRIFYVLKGGAYFFSAIQSPSQTTEQLDIADRVSIADEINTPANTKATVKIPGKDKPAYKPDSIVLYNRGYFLKRVDQAGYKKFRDSIIFKTKDSLSRLSATEINWRPFIPKPKEYVRVFEKDTLLTEIELSAYKKFRDSVNTRTKDTLYTITTFRSELHRFVPKPVWKPSLFVFTNNNGYLSILLPDALHKKYRIVFREMDGRELFEIKKVTERELVLDKTNFIHAGWFQFELYEDGLLKEKNKFFLQKD